MRGFISLLLLAGIFQAAQGQSGLAIRQYPQLSLALPWQPAADIGGSSPTLVLVARAGYGSNSLSLSQWPLGSDSLILDSAYLEGIASSLNNSPLRLTQSLSSDLWYSRPLKKRPLHIGLRQLQGLGGGLDQPNTIRLLYSNANIDSLADENIAGWLSSAYALSVGTRVINRDSFQVGVRLNLIAGTDFWGLRRSELHYGYTRTPLAEEVRVGAQYDLFRAGDGVSGIGASLDAGAIWQKEQWLLQAAVHNLGAIRWRGETYRDTFAVAFSGVTVPDADSAWADSLLNLVRPDTLASTQVQVLSPVLYASVEFNAAHFWRIFGSLSWTFPGVYQPTPLPEVSLGLGKSVVWAEGSHFFSFALTATAGGYAGPGGGVMVQYAWFVGDHAVRLFASLDRLAFTPNGATGYVGGSTGISVGL